MESLCKLKYVVVDDWNADHSARLTRAECNNGIKGTKFPLASLWNQLPVSRKENVLGTWAILTWAIYFKTWAILLQSRYRCDERSL